MSFSKLFKIGVAMATLGFSTAAYAGNYGDSYSVELNKTEILRLSQPAATVIVGNPRIADVSIHSSDTMFVIGRGYGQTNLIVMNQLGETIMNADIQVTGSTAPGSVRVFQRADRRTYHCAPYCLPAPVLGDNRGYVNRFTSKAPGIRNATITPPSTGPQGLAGVAIGGEPSDPNFGPGPGIGAGPNSSGAPIPAYEE